MSPHAWDTVLWSIVSIAIAATVIGTAGFIYAGSRASDAASEAKFRACVEHHPPLECSAAMREPVR